MNRPISHKTKLIGMLFFLGALLTGAGCKRCLNCQLYDSQGNLIEKDQKVCGNRDERDRHRSAMATKAAGIGGRYECEDSR